MMVGTGICAVCHDAWPNARAWLGLCWQDVEQWLHLTLISQDTWNTVDNCWNLSHPPSEATRAGCLYKNVLCLGHFVFERKKGKLIF